MAVNLSGLSMVEQIGLQQLKQTQGQPDGAAVTKRKRNGNAKPNSAAAPKKVKTRGKQAGPSQASRMKDASENEETNPTSFPSQSIPRGGQTSWPPSIPRRSGQMENQELIPPFIKHELYQDGEDTDIILLSGHYDITCPTAVSIFPYLAWEGLQITVCRDTYRDVWWGRFIWGPWDCVILMDPGPSHTLNAPCTLGWRLRDLNTGRLTFGQGRTGELTFFRNRRIDGTLFKVPEVGDLRFWGKWTDVLVGDACADEFWEEWEAFPRIAYGR
jgi:hypothetical protein